MNEERKKKGRKKERKTERKKLRNNVLKSNNGLFYAKLEKA